MSRVYVDFELNVDGKQKFFRIYEPTFKDQQEANNVRNKVFNEALSNGALLRIQLDDIIKKQKILDEEKEKEYNQLRIRLNEGEKKLSEGGININEAKDIALDMQEVRQKMKEILSARAQLENYTAEGQADNMAFNYLVSVCLKERLGDTKDAKEVPYFKNLDAYLSDNNSEVAYTAASKLASILYRLNDETDKNLPENKFLQDYGFVDDKLRLVNQDGKLINRDGKLIDEYGRLINENGELIDDNGNVITDDGTYKVEFKGFTNDSGEVVKPAKEMTTNSE